MTKVTLEKDGVKVTVEAETEEGALRLVAEVTRALTTPYWGQQWWWLYPPATTQVVTAEPLGVDVTWTTTGKLGAVPNCE